MGTLELLLTAIALAMDAFAIAICAGLTLDKANFKNSLIIGLYFGGFQAAMPLIGYFVGSKFADKISAVDHWIAFVLLAFLGIKMLIGALRKGDDDGGVKSPTFKVMLPLAVATSIDALAVGISFAIVDANIVVAGISIGVVTLALSMCGVLIGKGVGQKFKSKAEIFGGIILFAMGCKILISHLFFQ